MKKTALYQKHNELNARLIPFAGYEMPVEYSGVNDEHMHVRQKAGIFDVSHMGEFWVTGSGATDFLQFVTSNDVSKINSGQCQYTCMPNGNGGIVDDLIIYKFDDEKYMLVVNAANIEKDFKFLEQHNSFGVSLKNASDQYALLAIQGPEALPLMNKLTEIDLYNMKPFRFNSDKVAGIPDVIISSTGYTGEKGVELYIRNEDAPNIWDAIMIEGKSFDIKPIGLAARDTLRLEKGLCLYGNDIDDSTSPIEANLGWITKIKKNSNFLDKELLTLQKQQGVEKKLIGFEINKRGIPRNGYRILNTDGEPIGHVTSGTNSPVLKKGIGLGYVQTEYTNPDTTILIEIRNKHIEATIKPLPFV
ncbi:MAG: glycine cleavage system aminomethyltransferase GcvT [Bacteroidetes bacterium]|jgi:aminomethyltransferase|nr:glycine cleavage system aminomethyltransferase GcvT [Bacteroidota bacterium]